MTCYNIIDEKYLKENKELNISLNNDNEKIKIDLGIERENFYFNKEYNTTFIEIKDKDNIKNYLELDENIFNENEYYENKSIYLLQYLYKKEIHVSYGYINEINDKKEIKYICYTDNGSIGSPILNIKNNKVIGIHTGIFNSGILLTYLTKDYRRKKFKIIQELGEGGFGKVNQILNILDNKEYAMKEISLQGENIEQINNIKKEAKFLSKFKSDNIVKYYDSFIDKDKEKFYILMEYCNGKTLKNYLDEYRLKNTLIEEDVIFNIIKQICLGLKEIHEIKIVHRDLKPDNFFMNEKMEIKIGDFGISKQLSSYTTQVSNTKAGSLYYIAPELMANGLFNTKSDMWSLGCIIYELFHLNNYYEDKFFGEIKIIDSTIYNNKWQS
jgi:NIMA (never in mitosis gene a)-related kinase